jgi:ATP-binding cassette subfamily F protein 3
MLFPRNVLVLDEPTNHLDIPARETLEDALEQYEGTLLVVSHDRYFLDRICTRLLVIEGTHVEAHLGNYSDWRRRRAAAETEPPAEVVAKAPARPATKSPAKPVATPTAAARPPSESNAGRAADKEKERARRQLARRVETLEADVSKIETELTAVRADLAGDHAGDWQKLHTLADRERELDALLARRMAEWEAASAALLNQSPASPD